MSRFHSVVSRREFMKAIGLLGAGIGGASLVTPVFHDMDELIGSSDASWKRPWYVKEREFDHPTIEIDWDMMKRHDGRLQGQAGYTKAQYYGKDRVVNANAVGAPLQKARQDANQSGYRLRDDALYAGATTTNTIQRKPGDFGWAGEFNLAPTKTPEQLGVPKWTGTPEEASKMLRAAMRVYGASLVGYGEFTSEIRNKAVFSYEKGGANSNSYIDKWPPPESVARPIVYENVDTGYETSTKLVIPNKEMWEVSVSTQGSNELFRRSPAWGGFANRNTFMNVGNINACTQNFLRMIGYQKIGVVGNATPNQDATHFFAGGAGAILNGLGEASRQQLYTISPEYGAPGRLYDFVTDLPLAPNKPIDAGIFRFCHTCQKCANNCPAEVISFEKEPSWERPTVNGKAAIWTVQGTKAFIMNGPGCSLWASESGSSCNICWGECTFTVNHGAMIHDVVKSTIATTPLFNGFLFSMAETFEYGQKDPESWWDLELPFYGQDSNVLSRHGAYR